MKILRLKVNSNYEYFEHYVRLILQPFYNMGETEVKVLARMYDALHVELEAKVPLEAAIRLISSTEGRRSIMDKITTKSKKFNNQENELSDTKYEITDHDFE